MKYSNLKWVSVVSAGMLLAACDPASEEIAENEGVQEAVQEVADSKEAASETGSDFDYGHDIFATTREDGSGTRSAFVDIVGLEDEDGNDIIDQALSVQNGTNAVMTGVQEDLYSMGYISVGSLSDEVKALHIEGVEPTEENIASGDYQISRNFNLAYGQELSEAAQDFWDFVMSAEGQAIVADNSLVPVNEEADPFEVSDVSGNVQINGSTSVTPVIEVLAEAYNELNDQVTFDIASTGSSAGVTAAIDGTADIGMSSRELTDEEKEQLAGEAVIAIDGIVVIVNPENPVDDMTLEQLKAIYLGEMMTWEVFE